MCRAQASSPAAGASPAPEAPSTEDSGSCSGAAAGDDAGAGCATRFPGDPVEGAWTETPSGLRYYDLKVGTGDAPPADTTIVKVHYTGTLTDGSKFDSSRDRGQPFSFKLGAGQVIKGWDHGVAGMKIGGVRKLTIPHELAYGARGAGGVIAPYSTLIFEVDLLWVL